MNTITGFDRDRATDALIGAATAAGAAPSIHNTQPWRWRIHDGVADLYTNESRHLGLTDPQRRLLILSCGAALHHACVALAAEGVEYQVQRLPSGTEPPDIDHLATVMVIGEVPVTAVAIRHMQTIQIRRTDRRPLIDEPVPDEAMAATRDAAAAHGIGLHVLDRDAILDLAAATDRAQRDQLNDPATRAELDAWIGDHRPAGAGMPDTVIPIRPPQTTVPARDFGHFGVLDISDEHDRQARYAILFAEGDSPRDWLRGGEALSAAWLTATENNVAVLPLSAAVEEHPTRHVLQRALSGIGYPLLAMRLGIANTELAAPPHTPRLPSAQTVEVAGG